MENKYYTPELKELYIGFQCEMEVYLTKEFEPVEMTRSLIYDSYHLLDNNRLRVKYLDASDIESCGFDQLLDSSDRIIGHLKRFQDERVTYKITKSFNEYRIEVFSDISPYSSGLPVFIGNIKNLSELKQVLEMIGIEYSK